MAPNPPQDRVRPHKRTGPRPLPLHLATATLTWLSSAAALPFLKNGSPESPPKELTPANAWTWLATLPWHKTVQSQASQLRQDLADVAPDAFAQAVNLEVRRRLDQLSIGIEHYRRHSYRRPPQDARVVWEQGTTKLLDYAGIEGAPENGTPLLVVPSLVNRAYVLDLSAERSFMRFFASQGYRPFLVDWDRPGAEERGFSLSHYILDRLGAALDQVTEIAKRKPAMIGYCMGGNLALGLAHARPNDISALVLLATPWDFHAERADLSHAVAHAMTPWMPFIEKLGELPVDALQALFLGLDPFLGVRKFRAFSDLDVTSAKAREFVALEDWLNDGVPLAGPVARECILDWYGENTPARGEWRLAGKAVLPEHVKVRSLVVVPGQDRIVPPASAEILAQKLPGADRLSPPLGHIGMVVGSQARAGLWQPLAGWLDSALTRS